MTPQVDQQRIQEINDLQRRVKELSESFDQSYENRMKELANMRKEFEAEIERLRQKSL